MAAVLRRRSTAGNCFTSSTLDSTRSLLFGTAQPLAPDRGTLPVKRLGRLRQYRPLPKSGARKSWDRRCHVAILKAGVASLACESPSMGFWAALGRDGGTRIPRPECHRPPRLTGLRIQGQGHCAQGDGSAWRPSVRKHKPCVPPHNADRQLHSNRGSHRTNRNGSTKKLTARKFSLGSGALPSRL